MVLGKKLVAQSGVYFLGRVLRYAVSFVMLPIYTRLLTPGDYGTLELITTVVDFTAIIFGLQIGTALFRFHAEFEDPDQKHEVISTALLLSVIVNVVALLLLAGASQPVSELVFGDTEHRVLLLLFALTLLFQPLIEIPLTFVRAQQRPWLFISFNALSLIVTLSLNIYFVVLHRLGVTGVVLGAVVSNGLVAALLCGYCLRITGVRFSLAKARMLVSFSYPMMLASMASYYITFGDRYFLKAYGTLSDVGIYALGYKFGFLLTSIGSGPFLAVWDSERYNVLKRPDAKRVFQDVFLAYAVLTVVMVVLISVFARNVLMVMADPAFWAASRVVPIVLAAYLLQAWSAYCNLGILVEKKTADLAKSTALGAVVITVLYFLLIPRFGPMGAAWATALAWGVRFLYVYWKATEYYDMDLPWKRVSFLLVPSVAAVVISLFGPDDVLGSMVVNVVIAFLFLHAISLLPVLPVDQRLLVRRLLVRPWTMPRELQQIIKAPADYENANAK